MVNYRHMNAKTLWMTVGEFRAQVVRVAAVLTIGAIALTLLASLSHNLSRAALNYTSNIAAASALCGGSAE